ncbi:MAG TPA: hypothetical protein VGM39_14975 [Kofleriaceae bacterium]|jgi:hypothetical protein
MTNSTGPKLSPHLTWLFAIGAVLLGTGAYMVLPHTSKVGGYAYFGIIALGGFLATFLTRAKTGGAVLSFLVASLGAAAGYYLVIAKAASVAASTITTGSAADVAAAQHAVNGLGSIMGGFVAVIVFLVTFVPGTIGASVGSAVRGKPGAMGAASLARSLA